MVIASKVKAYIKAAGLNTSGAVMSELTNRVTALCDQAIATAIIAMARSLGLKVVGEGVETEEQLRFLASRECDVVQGFYYSPAVPSEAFLKLLTEGSQHLRPVAAEEGKGPDSAAA